jgi:CrcB protein
MSSILSIAFAGMLGVLLRYFISTWLDERLGNAFPWGTMAVNLLGCFLAGCVFQLMFERSITGEVHTDPWLRNALMVGFLGGFTTFSAYSVQSLILLRDNQWLAAALNVGVSNIAGIALAWAGYSLSRSL